MINQIDTHTILIVDDTPSNLSVVVNLFENRGYHVAIAQDGEEGLQRAQLVHPDLILLDVMLPGADGFEICRRLKAEENTREIPVIFMTSLASTEHKVKGFEAGGVDYVTKPLQLDEVIARVETHIKLRAMLEQTEAQNAELQRYRNHLEHLVEERTAELRKSNEQLHLTSFALNRVREAAYLIDEDARFIYVNDESCSSLGYTREELLTMTLMDIDPVWTKEIWEAAWSDFQKHGTQIIETIHRRKDGSQFPIEVNASYFEHFGKAYILSMVRDITERKANVRELQRWRDIFEHAEWGVVVGSADGRTLELMNPAFARMHGYSVEELTGRPIAEVFAPQSREDFPEQIRIAHEKGHHSYESWHVRKDGTIFPVFIDVTTVRGKDGQIMHRIVNVQDITERKQAERLLHEQEQAIRAVVENSPDTISRYDTRCRRIYVNSAMQKLFGLPLEQILGKTPEELSPMLEDFMQILKGVLESGHEFQTEFPFTKADGDMGWGDLRLAPEFGPDGAVVSVLAIGRDITKRKVAEDALRKSEEKYRTLIQKIQAAVVVHDVDTRILTSNSVAQEILGLSEDQLLGKTAIDPAWHFFREDGSPLPLDEYPVSIVRTSHKALRNYVMGVHRPEHENDVWALVNADPVFAQEGEITQIIVTFIDITERKRAEEALRESEQRFRGIFDNVLDTLYLLEVTEDGHFRNIEVNPAFEKSAGIPRAELIGKFIEETVPEETAHIVIEKYRRCIDAGHPIDEEVSLELPTGTRHFHSTLIPVRDNSGRISRIVGISRDITERKQAEQQLFMMDFALNHVREAVYLIREPKYMVYVNEEACRELGYSREELLGMTLFDIDPDADLEELQEIDDVTHRQGCHIFERRHRTKDGRILPVEILSTPFEYEGQLMSIALVRDITERKAMEAALLDREQQYRTLAENAPDIIMRYDRECRRIYVNPAFERELGISEEQALNVTPAGQWPPDVTIPVEEYIENLRHVMETGEPKLIVIGWPRRDEKGISIQYYDVRIVSEFDSLGNVTGSLVMGHNITSLKVAQQRLEESHWQLRRLTDHLEVIREEERKRLAHELHDEFGQLLTAIRMEISMLRLKYEHENIQFQDNVQRIVSLVDRTIKGVRNMASMLRPEVLEMGVVAALEWLVDEFSTTTGVSCMLQIDDGKIDLDEKSAIAIFRIVQESLTNVARHAKADKVSVVLKKGTDGIKLKIADNGQGFDPDLKKEKSLGLVGIRERAFMLGGNVEITSTSGQGTLLEVYLPPKGD